MFRFRKLAAVGAAAMLMLTGLATSACQSQAANNQSKDQTVTLLTHDSFKLPDKVKKQFQHDTGIKLKIVALSSGAQMVSKLALTKDAPLGDAVYGLDSTTMGLVAKNQILADAKVKPLPGDKDWKVEGVPAYPVDRGDVCVNIDTTYFAKKNLQPPVTLADLAKPEYKGLLVTENPSTSATGEAFMYATIAAFGQDKWLNYWKSLKANNVRVVKGWTEAYEQDFTQGGKDGKYPIVVSYATSPSATVSKDGKSATSKNLPDTCLRVVEYAGVLAHAKHPQAAAKVVDWLRGQQAQSAIPENMYMYPIRDVKLDETWKKFAPEPGKTQGYSLDGKLIAKNREAWLRAVQDVF